MQSTGGVAGLVDRRPSVTPERLVAQLVPPPTFADVSFDTYRPDPNEPSQAAAVGHCRRFCELAKERRAGKKKLFGKRRCCPVSACTSTAGSVSARPTCWRRRTTRWPRATPRSAFATFGELTQLAGVFGFTECIDLLADYAVVCIDEFELDDPGNTTLISRLLSALVERGVSIAATSNTLPEQLGEGRFAAQDFLREINTLSAIFTTIRIEGPDYRHRGYRRRPEPLTDDEVRTAAAAKAGATLDDFDALCAHPGHHAPVALSRADRRCHRGVHHRGAPDQRSECGAATGGADGPAAPTPVSRFWPRAPSWTPSSAMRWWRAGSARSICAPHRACWR